MASNQKPKNCENAVFNFVLEFGDSITNTQINSINHSNP